MNIPQGYKQTELGIIPEDWEIVNLGSIAKINGRIGFRGYTVADLVPKGFGAITLSPSNIIDNQIDYTVCTYISWYKYDESPEIKVNNGDILLVKTGSTFGKSALVNNLPEKATINPQFVLLNNIKCDNKYLSYIIKHDIIQNQIHSDIVGGAIPTLSQEKISKFILFLPPLSEQKAIAEALSDVDDLITALDKKIAKKRLIKQGAMHRLIGSSETNKLQSVLLRNIVNIRKGSMLTSDNFVPGNIPVIAGGKTPAGFHNIANRPEKTITISASGANAGYVALYDKPIFATDCSTIEPTSKYNIEYIYYLLKYYQNDIYTMQTGGAQPHIHPSDLNDLRILYTDNLQKQQAIATILSDMDKEIAELEAQYDKYRLVKSGMMQKLLTGEIRLKKPQASQILESKAIPVDAHIIAGHIVNRLYKSEGWGRTKLQKSLHLAGYYAQIYIGNEYIRNTAGPDDQRLMNYIDQQFRQFNHVKITRVKLNNGKIHYNYTPTSLIQEVEMAYEKYPENVRKQIDLLLDKMNVMDLDCAEILSTLYGVWNNRIIKSERITDDLLIADFYAWSKHKLEFDESRLRKALVYMREENIVPIGWGKYIDKKN